MKKKSNNQELFRSKSDLAKDSILLNWHGEPIEEFSLYAEAYHCAAKKLVSEYGTTGAIRDFESTPILFLYRHAFELYLKAFVLVGSKILALHGKTTMPPDKIFETHKLTNFLPHFEAILGEVGWSWDMGEDGLRQKRDFVGLIHEFEAIDPSSFSFRYPTNKKGSAALPDHFSFNLSLFAKRMDPLLEIIDGALTGLEELWNSAAKSAYEAQ